MTELLIEWVLYVCMSTFVAQCPAEDLAYMRHLTHEECIFYAEGAKQDVPSADTECVSYDRRGI